MTVRKLNRFGRSAVSRLNKSALDTPLSGESNAPMSTPTQRILQAKRAELVFERVQLEKRLAEVEEEVAALDYAIGVIDWTIAIWFAQPNSWLADQRPVDLLHCNLAAVVQAARADRFVARG